MIKYDFVVLQNFIIIDFYYKKKKKIKIYFKLD